MCHLFQSLFNLRCCMLECGDSAPSASFFLETLIVLCFSTLSECCREYSAFKGEGKMWLFINDNDNISQVQLPFQLPPLLYCVPLARKKINKKNHITLYIHCVPLHGEPLIYGNNFAKFENAKYWVVSPKTGNCKRSNKNSLNHVLYKQLWKNTHCTLVNCKMWTHKGHMSSFKVKVGR